MPLNKTLYIEEGLDILKRYDAIFIPALKGMQRDRLLLPIMLGEPSKQDTTIHALTNDQTVTDVRHKDLRRARSGVENMIPTKTGAAKAVGLVLPDLKGKLDGLAIRVPTVNVSLVDLSFQAGRDTSAEEINALMKAASEEGRLKGVLAYNTLPLVSMDFNHTTQASTFDSTLTKVTAGKMVKVFAWYDNEWGFSCQMLNTARRMFGLEVRPF